MPTIAFCGGCSRYVELTPDGVCPQGHPRSQLRDVREGTLAAAPSVGAGASGGTAAAARPAAAVAAEKHGDEIGLGAQILGKSIVIVPIVLIVAWGLWTGYDQFPGPPLVKLFWDTLSLVATAALTFGWYAIRRRKRR